MKRISLLVALGAAVGLWACEFPVGLGCAGVGYYALHFEIRDARGDPQALGAAVTLTDGSYAETDSANWDPLSVYAANDRGGRTYDVRISKPHYNDVLIRNVKTRGGGCVTGHETPPVTITLPVALTLSANAPPMRSVRALPPHVLLDRAYTTSFTPSLYIDANPGVSRAVTWRISGDTASVSLDAATGRLTYRCLPKSGQLALFATSVVDPSLSGVVDVAVQGHPGNSGDPPCS